MSCSCGLRQLVFQNTVKTGDFAMLTWLIWHLTPDLQIREKQTKIKHSKYPATVFLQNIIFEKRFVGCPTTCA